MALFLRKDENTHDDAAQKIAAEVICTIMNHQWVAAHWQAFLLRLQAFALMITLTARANAIWNMHHRNEKEINQNINLVTHPKTPSYIS